MRYQWNAVLLLASLAISATAFTTPLQQRKAVTPAFITAPNKHATRVTTTSLFNAPSSLSETDPDRIRRRQLLVSMLAAASAAAGSTQAATAATTPTATTTVTSSTTNIIVPPLDDSQYIAYTLENGLRVLLCSDPSSNEAAAAMDVHVGACSDPDAIPGLAHFNEHMLFLGTKPYPKEDSFESFLSSNGGASNAFTDSLDTVYYFDMAAVDSDAKFAEGLVRFGSFFSAPLFTKTATDRELNAIESENKKNLQTDSFRVFQLAKARANPDHPYSKFFTGNKFTLLDNTRAQGIDLREELIRFYETYYSASQMTLAVVGPQSLDDLQSMVQKAFSTIPNRGTGAPPEESWRGIPPFSASAASAIPAFGHILEVVPVKDIRQVTISWPTLITSPEQLSKIRLDKPSNYVAHLLGHEGPGSLLSYLKLKGWANSVASATEEELSDFESFDVVVGLTSSGLEQVDSVLEAVFSYIQYLVRNANDIPNYIFQEVLQLDELNWRFETKTSGSGYAQGLTTSMQRYPPELYVAGPRRLVLSDYDSSDNQLTGEPRTSFASLAQLEKTKGAVGEYTKSLTVDNAIISVLSKSFQGKTDSKEKWYGTDYRARPIPPATLARWQKPTPAKKLQLAFPKPNPFIPSEAGLQVRIPRSKVQDARDRTFEARMQPVPPPKVIRDDERWKVYFRPDDRFGKPTGYLIFQVMTKEVFASPMNAALASLLELCATDRLTEYAYDASLAGLTYDVKVMPRGVRLTFGGYNDKLLQFASYVSRKLSKDMNDLLPKNDQDFERYKDQVMRILASFDVKQPYSHAAYYSTLVVQPQRTQYDNKELRDATRRITRPDLIDYAGKLWNSGKGEALIQGNFVESEAQLIVDKITGVLPFKPIPEDDIPPRIRSLSLPTCTVQQIPPILFVSEPNPSDENACANVQIQNMDPSEKEHVLMELVGSIIREPFYNELRTKQQLGYIVSSGVRGLGDARTLAFIVQSSVADADILTSRILTFLDTVEDSILNKISKGDIAVYGKSLIDRKTERDKDLAVEVTRNWGEIASGRLEFDRLQREASVLLDITKDDLVAFWRKIYASDQRRMLITEVVPREGAASSEAPRRSYGYAADATIGPDASFVLGIDDIDQFRRDREVA